MTTTPIRGRILIVEDDQDNRTLLQEFLAGEGYVTATAIGSDAMATARRFQPDVILLNLMLADTSGVEVSAALRAEPVTATMPIILTSARPDADEIAHHLSVQECLSKPFDLEDLLRVLARWMPA